MWKSKTDAVSPLLNFSFNVCGENGGYKRLKI